MSKHMFSLNKFSILKNKKYNNFYTKCRNFHAYLHKF